MSTRLLSYSEISTALDCQARWDFRYSDSLAGSSLKEKAVAPLLSGGSAWGAAVAAWHTHVDQIDAGELAVEAMDHSLEADADRQREFGLHDQELHDQLRMELLKMLIQYFVEAEPVKMDPVTERELIVPIPSRSGSGRGSSRYKLLCFLDATSSASAGTWIEEFKLRGRLSPVSVIVNGRQIRWYAWAYWQATGDKPVGVFVNERLREVPKPPRVLASGKLSHAKEQHCTADAYVSACQEYGVEPKPETQQHLAGRRWQQRVPVMFRDGELEEAGRELVSAARMIQLLESGGLMPLRNAKRSTCGYCPYADICPAPDSDLVEALFERRPPKRDRDPDELLHR